MFYRFPGSKMYFQALWGIHLRSKSKITFSPSENAIFELNLAPLGDFCKNMPLCGKKSLFWGLQSEKIHSKYPQNILRSFLKYKRKNYFLMKKIFFQKFFEFKKKSIFVKFVQNHQKLSIEPTLRGSRASGKCFRNF